MTYHRSSDFKTLHRGGCRYAITPAWNQLDGDETPAQVADIAAAHRYKLCRLCLKDVREIPLPGWVNWDNTGVHAVIHTPAHSGFDWECDHPHPTVREAATCARAEYQRRGLAQAPAPAPQEAQK